MHVYNTYHTSPNMSRGVIKSTCVFKFINLFVDFLRSDGCAYIRLNMRTVSLSATDTVKPPFYGQKVYAKRSYIRKIISL